MPPFPRPRFAYDYQAAAEIRAINNYIASDPNRAVPARAASRLLLATWNVANLGVQERREKDYRLIASIMGWFDLIAVQEVHGNLAGIQGIAAHLDDSYRLLFSDTGGNDERLTFIYDSTKVELLDEIGEVAPSPSEFASIKLPGIVRRFEGFDRTPYLATFKAGSFTFSLVNVHLFYGGTKKADIDRRALEALAVASWASRRRSNRYAFTTDVIPLGDFNLPKVDSTDPIYRALTRRGLRVPKHSTQIGSAIASDNRYDQIIFFPGETADDFTGRAGVVDYDGAVFRRLWTERGREDFIAYCRYYVSDHRPLWAQFRI